MSILVARLFTIDEARTELQTVLTTAAEIVVLRADLAEARARQLAGEPIGGLAEVKAKEARLSELLDELVSAGIEVKGIAPLLLDFPALVDGREVLLCWLEGETELAWYHDSSTGFAGRRPLRRG